MIEKIKNCCIARSKKVNEVIGRLNPLLNIEVVVDPFADEPSIVYTDNNVLLTLTEGGGGDVSGDVSGFDEEVIDIIDENNVPTQRIFLTKTAP